MPGVPADQTGAAVSSVVLFATTGTEPSTALGREALADAASSYISAFSTVMFLTAAISLLSYVGGFLLLRTSEREARGTPVIE